jgi:hypothetical protein
MTKGRDIAVESIGDLLEVARLQQRNGLLRAECSQGGRLEEGELYLQAGQPIYARVGNLTGHEALNYLLSWRNIHFAFSSDVPRPPANLIAGVRASRESVSTSTSSSVPERYPINISPSIPERYPTTQGLRWNNVAERNDTLPTTQGLRWNNAEERNDALPVQRNMSLSGMAWLVPQKIDPEQDVLSLSLTRRQRLIYLLIDGQRTVSDLARTAGKAAIDVELILSELQERGLITK